MAARARTLEIDDQRLEGAWWGPAPDAAPTLVLLHEGLGCVGLWNDFPAKLADATGCGVFAYSRAGYGKSSAIPLPRPLSYMHDEARERLPKILDCIGFRKGALIGHSDGASIALIHAASHPATDLGVVLMAPHVLVEPISQAGIARASEAFERQDLRARLARHHAHVEDAFYGWSRAWLDPTFRTWSLGAECERLAVPTLLVQGERDEYGTLAQLDAIAASAKGPVERLVLDCGHTPWREDETAVLDAIVRFAAPLIVA